MKDILRKIIPKPILLFYHKAWAILANIIYWFPGRKLYVIGVTGTNGKTTTVSFIASILEEAGYKIGMTSTVHFQVGLKKWLNKTKMTVPGHFFFPRMLCQMVRASCQYAVLEISSHALHQYRTWGVPFDATVITNLTHDHLDYHRDFNDYRITKGRLFANLSKSLRKPNSQKVSVINADDKEAWYFAQFWAEKKYAYTLTSKDIGIPCVKASGIKFKAKKTSFVLNSPIGKINISLNLIGKFNVANACAAAAFALSQDINLSVIKKGLGKIKGVSGRMEEVDERQKFKVIVDYAHTPDAFSKVFASIRPVVANKIISVFGATGDRDREKRPILGEIGAHFSDYIILTLEDPGSEDPEKIIKEIEPGVIKEGKILGKTYFKIVNRRKAIKKAFELASKDDIVLLLAKGHEQVMQMRGKKVPWDDRKVAHELLKNLLKKTK
jgi:UDP-N-acetylmuramoyl-L-alanyl-D-glutamate--2,6-diaminopimelate ligase